MRKEGAGAEKVYLESGNPKGFARVVTLNGPAGDGSATGFARGVKVDWGAGGGRVIAEDGTANENAGAPKVG